MTLREAKDRVLDPMYYGLLCCAPDAPTRSSPVRNRLSGRVAAGARGDRRRDGRKHVSGIYMMIFRPADVFFADTNGEHRADAETLAEIATAPPSS